MRHGKKFKILPPRLHPYQIPTLGDDALLVDPSGIAAIVANGARTEDAYFKIGDSNTGSPYFMRPFQDSDNIGDYSLGEFGGLEPTLNFFRFNHIWDGPSSLSNTRSGYPLGLEDVNHVAIDPPTNPSPLTQSINGTGGSPGGRYAILMHGTNQDDTYALYETHMRAIVAQCTAAGVITIMTTIPQCTACGGGGPDQIPFGHNEVFAEIQRRIALDTRIPLLDLRKVTDTLPDLGLSDGKHLSVYGNGGDLTAPGLLAGFNVRNMLTLKMLKKVKAVRDAL